uniref:amidohydrolase family protein n=1 Tax=Marinobacterium profundum TaxID=1714300 RepID=UPI0008362E76|nr:amidohydrolase family protein [Marinobacterium profundum]
MQKVLPLCDCHMHVFDRNGAATNARYTPPAKDLSDYLAEATDGRISRAVVIQASVDGTDNSRLVSVLGSATDIELRGVAMIDRDTGGLEELAAAGIRAIRIQDRTRLGRNDLELLPELSRRAAEVGWHVELNTEPQRFDVLAGMVRQLPEGLVLVLDHLGHCNPNVPADLDGLCRLLETGRVWVKLSPTRVSQRIGQYDDLCEMVRRIANGFPDRCVWGSDWPHVMTEPPLPETADMLTFLSNVLSSTQFEACLSTNPAVLYRF